jgi:Na+/H+-dicarboxylate symporter/ABC-type amino acid transport substrate-binding protein
MSLFDRILKRRKEKKKLGLTSWIIIGLVAGILTGLFFGEDCAKLKIIGVVFIQLLQMTILPYILVSLIVGIGGLSFSEAKRLALRGGALLFLFWGAILLVVFLMPLVFPTVQSASFFSTNMVTEPPPENYLSLYIPANPFSSLAFSMVPAIVLFGICIGVALIGIEEKKSFLQILSVGKDALTKVAKAIVYLTPIGVFAFAANAAGTLTIDQIARLQVFFITFILMSLILTFLIFPMIVTSLTPFSYRQIFKVSKAALITSFTTGNLFIVLPLIAENVKTLLASDADSSSDNHNLPDVIIPVTFNFPDAGQLGSVLFILFGSWFAGDLLSVTRYPDLALSGLLSFFGGSNLAIPYLLNHYHLSMDYFQLYIIAGIVNGYFATIAAAMHLITFTIVCSYSMSHGLKISMRKIIINAAISFSVILVLLSGTRIYLEATVKSTVSDDNILNSMSIKNPVKFTIKPYPTRTVVQKLFGSKNAPNRLQKIKESHILRVGFNVNTMPFVFKNSKGELLGYDIQMAHNLARALDCELTFIPINFDQLAKALDDNVIDIAMSAIYVSLERIESIAFTDIYMQIHPALIVKDFDQERFKDLAKIRKDKAITIAILKGNAYTKPLQNYIAGKVVEIDSYTDFYEGKVKADALYHSAEQGATWVLKYPQYSVVVLKNFKFITAVAYAIAKGDLAFLEYLNYWLTIQKWNKVTDDYYSYWILGNVPEIKQPRWSILNNVIKKHFNVKEKKSNHEDTNKK